MSVLLFEGAAGTGKTTAIMDELKARLSAAPLRVGQKVLALTFMHGARRRLRAKLSQTLAGLGSFDCMTFDSFAWRLVNRWRTLATACGLRSPATDLDYEGTCLTAAALLLYPAVQQWVASTYPLLVVDEAQDCRAGRLGMMRGLAEALTLIAAADEFQDLNITDKNESVAWLEAAGYRHSLCQSHRTKMPGLLAAAQALRNCDSIDLSNCSKGFRVFSAANVNAAASFLMRNLTYNGRFDTAILSPARPGRSPFVKGAVERSHRPMSVDKGTKTLGPFAAEWLEDAEAAEMRLREHMGIPAGGDTVDSASLATSASEPGLSEVRDWLDHRRRLTGTTLVATQELDIMLKRTAQALRGQNASRSTTIPAMTIHQAKNQEFRHVLILWPLAVGGSAESKRRLLYNAITRAKEHAVVIVQNDPRSVDPLTLPPFKAKN